MAWQSDNDDDNDNDNDDVIFGGRSVTQRQHPPAATTNQFDNSMDTPVANNEEEEFSGDDYDSDYGEDDSWWIGVGDDEQEDAVPAALPLPNVIERVTIFTDRYSASLMTTLCLLRRRVCLSRELTDDVVRARGRIENRRNGSATGCLTVFDGRKHGRVQWFARNGTLRHEEFYVDGKRHGLHREWWDHGQLFREMTYVYGVEHGMRREYDYTDGHLEWEIPHVNGRENGFTRLWHANGNLQEETTFVDNKRQGQGRSWHENGTLRSETVYDDDLKNGVERRWRADGTLDEEIMYVNEKRNGLARFWRQDGTRQADIGYMDGKRHGLARFWREDGTLRREVEYAHGQEVNQQQQAPTD